MFIADKPRDGVNVAITAILFPISFLFLSKINSSVSSCSYKTKKPFFNVYNSSIIMGHKHD